MGFLETLSMFKGNGTAGEAADDSGGFLDSLRKAGERISAAHDLAETGIAMQHETLALLREQVELLKEIRTCLTKQQ